VGVVCNRAESAIRAKAAGIGTARAFCLAALAVTLIGSAVLTRCIGPSVTESDEDLLQLLAGFAIVADAQCRAKLNITQSGRVFQSGFESVADFSPFYIVPQNYQNAASHDLKTDIVYAGASAHAGWIYAAGPDCPFWQNCNHRGYPTVQLHRLAGGGFRTPVLIEFQAYLDVSLAAGQWFSFATLSADASDAWRRTILVNLGSIDNSSQNYTHLMHVPLQGQAIRDYQTSDLQNATPYPSTPQWVKLTICIDLHPDTGFARVWQNGTLVSAANVAGGCGILEQAHFGLYAPPGLASGTVYNDELSISEVAVCPGI
jgi:hypothetical protein